MRIRASQGSVMRFGFKVWGCLYSEQLQDRIPLIKFLRFSASRLIYVDRVYASAI